MAQHPGCTTSLPERCPRHLVPALLRDCPAAALPLSRALSITPPGSGGGRASQHLASSWAFVGTGTGKVRLSLWQQRECRYPEQDAHPTGSGEPWLLCARTQGRSCFGHLRSIEGATPALKKR